MEYYDATKLISKNQYAMIELLFYALFHCFNL